MGWVKLDSGVRVNLDRTSAYDGSGLSTPEGQPFSVTDADIARLDAACGLTEPEIPEQYRRWTTLASHADDLLAAAAPKPPEHIFQRLPAGGLCSCGAALLDEEAIRMHCEEVSEPEASALE